MPEMKTGDRVRVRLVNDEYMIDHGGRLRAGTAVEVDQQTADRWLRTGIAEEAKKGDRTLREQKLALIAQLQGEVQDLAPVAEEDDEPVSQSAGGNFDSMITREDASGSGRRGRRSGE